jgi:iron complex outermembrane receptor protein
MKSVVKFVGLGMTGALSLAGGTAYSADSSANPGDDQLTTIVVTAEKREESIQNVPMGVSAVSGNILDNLEMRSFEDYAALVPGMSAPPWRCTSMNRHSAPAVPCSTVRF